MADVKEAKKVVIEIPVGKYLKTLRSNPWKITSIVLAVTVVALLILIFLQKPGFTDEVVSKDVAGQNLISFINSQGKGSATYVSSSQEGRFYKVIVNYQSQDVPVLVTMDGQYLVGGLIPLNNSLLTDAEVQKKTTGPVSVEIGDSPVKGNANAPVTIVEFSDYECPFCGKFYTETYKKIDETYIKTGKVKIVFKDFPLSFHPHAQKAAEAARCVGEQKGDAGYFKMHDLIFEHQTELSVENEKKWARTLGVNGAVFDKCLDSGKYSEAIKKDLDYGKSLRVSGTPAFFINGMFVNGAQPYSTFQEIIDQEIAKAAGTQ